MPAAETLDDLQGHDLALPFETVGILLDRYAARDPDRVALVDLDQDGKSINWGALNAATKKVAAALSARGVKAGDKVALLSDESLEKLVLWLGIWRLGAAVCPLNVEMNQAHLREILQNIGPVLSLWHTALDGAAMTEGVNAPDVAFGAVDPETGNGEGFFEEVSVADPEGGPDGGYGPLDLSCIFCTSGTTSKPKSVVYNHLSYWLSGLSTLDMLGLDENDRTLEYRSFGWNSAQILSLMPWLQTGLTMHIAQRFSRSRFFGWIRNHGITFSAGVPTVVNMLLNEPPPEEERDVPSLRLMTCSTAPLSPDQWARFEEMYGITLLQLYGMSEAGWICGNRHYRRRMGTVGPPARHQEFIIVGSDGEKCPPGIEGEVSIGGPQSCSGVITPEGDYEDLAAARIKTGDLAVMDDDGFVTVTGRTKDLIIRGGVNIAPLEIDNVLLSHAGVREAATIGIPDNIYGEEIACYVVADEGDPPSADDIRGHCAAVLPDFKVPREVHFVDDIPKSDRGKVRRDDLKDIWRAANPDA